MQWNRTIGKLRRSGRFMRILYRVYPQAIALLLGLIFIAFKWSTLAPRFSDGHLYSYMGFLINEGWLPYQDFYYSSPPFLPYFSALLIQLFGFDGRIDLYVPLGAALIDGILLASILQLRAAEGTERLKRPSLSLASASAAACLLLLFSFCMLATSDFATDVHPITVFVLLGLFLAGRSCFFAAGIALGLAGLIKVYGLMGAVGLFCALVYLRRWRELAKVSAGLCLSFGLVCLGFWLWLGADFLQQVLLNNLGRPPGLDKLSILSFFVKHDPLLSLLAFMVPLILWLPRFKILRKDLRVFASAMLGAFLVFCLFYHDSYYLYFLPLCALLALFGGIFVGSLEKLSHRSILAALLLASIFYTGARYRSEQAHAAVIDGLPEIVARVAAITRADEGIYGDVEFTPLVALLARRSISAHLVETNMKFFNQGVFRFEDRIAALRKAGTRIILSKVVVDEKGQIGGGANMVLPRAFLVKHCQVDSLWPIRADYWSNAVAILECDLK